MDDTMFTVATQGLPLMNPVVCDTLVSSQIENSVNYIHRNILAASESFPDGLIYEGIEECNALEQFRYITRLKQKRTCELTTTDQYLLRTNFSFRGEKLRPKYFYLPFNRDSNLIHINGTQYKILPVVAGKVFNVEDGKVFMPIQRHRLVFIELWYQIMMSNKDEVTGDYVDKLLQCNVIYSPLYNSKNNKSSLRTLLAHYIFIEYGLLGGLKYLLDVDNIYISDDINELLALGPEYTIYYSTTLLKAKRSTPPNPLRIAIPKTVVNTVVNNIIASVYYITDWFPLAFNVKDIHDKELWKIMLDKFIFKNTTLDVKGLQQIESHLDSLSKYIDTITLDNLMKNKIKVTDIYSLFKYIIFNFHDIVVHSDIGVMYSKEISVTKYLLYTLVRGIFDGMYKLKKLQGNVLNPIKVNEVLDSIFNKSTSLSVKFHPELMADAPANHCKIFGSTLLVISQNRANGASSGVSKTITSDMLLHPSIIETCSYTTPSKAEPTGRNKLSPFAKLENAKRFVPNPKNVTVIDTVAQYIR